MTEKLKNLRDKLTEKQAEFVKLHKEGQDRGDAYINAGYKAKTKQQAQINASRLFTKNDKVIAYFEALKANDDRKTNISRSMQLTKLNQAFNVAKGQDNPSAMVSAIREQNEMLGFHRESAPNPEKERAMKDLVEAEREALAEAAVERTKKLSEGQVIPLKGA